MKKNKINILGISSATNTVSAAIFNGATISECSVAGDNARSEQLIPLIDEVIKRSGLKLSDMDAVAVTSGPGSYSGLRGGVATAKGLVAALKIPVISVKTLDCAAYNFIDHEGTVLVALHACKDEYNIALFGCNNAKVKRLTKDMTVTLDKLSKVISKVEGDLLISCDRDIKDSFKAGSVRFASSASAIPWAKNTAVIATEKFNDKDTENALSFVPVYSHKPNIREWKK
jgi:tRNA threonylcarbamoyladenosine biosynthesis protein TsaB